MLSWERSSTFCHICPSWGMGDLFPRGEHPPLESPADVLWESRARWLEKIHNKSSPSPPHPAPSPPLLPSLLGSAWAWGRRWGGAHLQLLVRPLEELNLLIVLLLLYQSPLNLPLLDGLTLGFLLVHLPLQIFLFCFQFCNLRTEIWVILGCPQGSGSCDSVEGTWAQLSKLTLSGSVLPPSGGFVTGTARP